MLKNGIDVRLPEAGVEQRSISWSRSTATRSFCRRDIAAVDLRLPDRVTVRLSDEAAPAREERSRPRSRRKGATHEPPRRPDAEDEAGVARARRLVAALDIGTSKIVCLIARLKPHAPQEVLRRRSHGIEVLGFGHTELARHEGRRRDQSRRGRGGGAPRRRSRRAHGAAASSNRWWSRCRPAGSAANCSPSPSTSPGDASPRATSRACSRPAAVIRCARAASCCIRCRSAIALDDVRGIREPRGMLARRFGVDMHVVTADVAAAAQPDAGGRALPSRRSRRWWRPLCRRPCGARRRRGRSRRGADRHGRRHHHDRGVLRRPLRPCRRLRARRPSRHHGHGARPDDQYRTMPSESRRSTAACSPAAPDERDMIAVPAVGEDEREPPQFVSRATLDAHHQAAGRGNPRNGPRPARRLAVRGRAARPRHR